VCVCVCVCVCVALLDRPVAGGRLLKASVDT
jgi:hypothetical protein